MAKATSPYAGLVMTLLAGTVVWKLWKKQWPWESISGRRTALNAGRYLRQLPAARRSVARPTAQAGPQFGGLGFGEVQTVYTPPKTDPGAETIAIIGR